MTSTTRHREEPSAHPLERHMDEFSEQLVACYDEIAALQDASEALGQLLDRTSIAERSLAMALRTTGATRGAFYSRDENGWERLAVTGDVGRELPEAWESVLGSRPKPLVQNRAQPDALSGFERVAPGFRNFLLAPLPGQEGLAGILALFDVGSEGFESGDAKMVQAIARQAATALSNERHHRKLLQAQEEILVAQKLAAMGEMAAEIGHELNNYLTSILGQVEIAQVLIAERGSEGVEGRLGSVASYVDKMAVLTRGLLRCSRQRITPRECRVRDIVEESVAFVSPQNRFDYAQFEVCIPEGFPEVHWDPNQMQQVFLNLFANAADAMGEEGGKISVLARSGENADWLEILVSDEGPGIPEHIRGRIFEPRFTTKTGGNGFGLAVCFRIVRDHGGVLRLLPDEARGATFALSLPITPDFPESAEGENG